MFGIFVHHLWGGRPGHGGFESALAFFCDLGQFGVILFNFMTGFVLALPYLGYECRPVPPYVRFLRRRFLRIVPAYYLAVVFFTGLNFLVFSPVRAADGFLRLFQHLLFLQGADPSTLSSNTAAYWYLSLLAQFYLAFPLVLRVFTHLGPGPACLLTCGICWGGLGIWTLTGSGPDAQFQSLGAMIYFNLPARLPEFAVGMWLAAAWRPGTAPSHGLPVDRSFGLFALGMLTFGALATPWARHMVLPVSLIHEVSCCVAFFVLLFLWPSVGQWGKASAVRSISLASYGIFLVHQPLFSYWGHWLKDPLNPVAAFSLSLILLAPVAYLLGRSLEPASAFLLTIPAKLKAHHV
jgi:peptidoglycan/LPS O-acetylase OafA/YrhL